MIVINRLTTNRLLVPVGSDTGRNAADTKMTTGNNSKRIKKYSIDKYRNGNITSPLINRVYRLMPKAMTADPLKTANIKLMLSKNLLCAKNQITNRSLKLIIRSAKDIRLSEEFSI